MATDHRPCSRCGRLTAHRTGRCDRCRARQERQRDRSRLSFTRRGRVRGFLFAGVVPPAVLADVERELAGSRPGR